LPDGDELSGAVSRHSSRMTVWSAAAVGIASRDNYLTCRQRKPGSSGEDQVIAHVLDADVSPCGVDLPGACRQSRHPRSRPGRQHVI
jgi:hypothetical protein